MRSPTTELSVTICHFRICLLQLLTFHQAVPEDAQVLVHRRLLRRAGSLCAPVRRC
ncbi:hypothetical protein PF005_g25616 [Phytophthora fragariae]|uniref:Uncharacterized protein n=2 Tax=Phytophthora TaxID=4783 RepID=A0A6A3QEB3_9STRA|nr:hypothetical protein PF009_g26292 [Phytophthora fragariae]KAE8961555.1 hypothetical protein PR002_g29861 [Phytophthora rubi]KAE8963707.1 hypothetical protein PR001_g29286 [Phytophthora rubi]KAE8975679.1 hypothetical protein PF011_g24365 [Phytophthora fragariae]KAE9073880.1 hypothetical protein PF007_g25633 [Phytophthora fragariae]